MKFFAIAASFVAAVAAQGYDTGAETCSVSTVTETVTLPYGVHTPSAPSVPSAGSSLPPYPTSQVAPYPIPSGTGVSVVPSGTPAPSGTGAPAPSGTGAYTTSAPYFTGAASSNQVAGFVAGVGAVAAMFL